MKKIFLLFGLMILPSFSYAGEKSLELTHWNPSSITILGNLEYTTINPEKSFGVQKVSLLDQREYQVNRMLGINFSYKEKYSSDPQRKNPLREELKKLSEIYKLNTQIWIPEVTQKDGEEPLHKILIVLHHYIPMPDSMIQHICQFMKTDNPFFRSMIPNLCDNWFHMIEKRLIFSRASDHSEKEDFQLSPTEEIQNLLQEIIERAHKFQEKASYLKLTDFLQPLAQRCEEVYGLEHPFTFLLCEEILKDNLNNDTLRRKIGELKLIHGFPREEAFEEGAKDFFSLQNRTPEDAFLLARYGNFLAGGSFIEDRLAEINFQDPLPLLCAQLLREFCSLRKEYELLKIQQDRRDTLPSL